MNDLIKKIKSIVNLSFLNAFENPELSKNYSFFSLLIYILPSILTFVFVAIYQMVDGIFIEKIVSPYAISAVNLYYPIISLFIAIGIMLANGGNAMIVELIGEGENEEASKVFSQVIIVIIIIGVVFSVIGIVFAEPIMKFLGASPINIIYLRDYYTVLTLFAPTIILQTAIGIFLIGEGKTTLTGVVTVFCGLLNIVLDYVFMKIFGLGVKGAAYATVIGYVIPILYGIYFYSPIGESKYHINLVKINFRVIGKVCFVGSADMIANLAGGITAFLINILSFKYYKEVGVSVASVFLYIQFLIIAVFMGITTATEPLLSYHYGAGNVSMRKKIYKLTLLWTLIFSTLIAILLALFDNQLANFFFHNDGDSKEFYELACVCIYFTVPACLFVGFNIFSVGIFTAFSNGLISAIISSTRAFIIFIPCIYILTYLIGSNGIWASWAVSECIACVISLVLVLLYRKKYFN